MFSREDFLKLLSENVSYRNWLLSYIPLLEKEELTEKDLQDYFFRHSDFKPNTFVASFEEIINVFFEEEDFSIFNTHSPNTEEAFLHLFQSLLEKEKLDLFISNFKIFSVFFFYLHYLVKQKKINISQTHTT